MLKHCPSARRAGTFLTCVWLVLVAPGCTKSTPTEPSSGAAPSGAAPSGAAPAGPAPRASASGNAADHAEGVKLHAAIECLNRHSNRVAEARAGYLKDVDPATGSSHGKKVSFYGLYGTDSCARDVKEAGAVQPALPALDNASAAYVSALEALVKVWEEIDGYYQKGDYLDDGGKKATSVLHPKVMDALKTFSAANKELSATVKTLNRARRVKKLAAREKAEGRTLSVLMDALMLESETLIEKTLSTDASAEALDPQIAVVSKLIDEVIARAGAHKDEESKWGSMGNIKNYSQAFLGAAKVIARKLRTNAKPTIREREEVNSNYNSLVENYNH